METFSFNPSINLSSRKWFLSVSGFETTNSIFNMTRENHVFSISTPSYWTPEDIGLKELLELRSENDIKLFVEVIEEGNQMKNGDKKCNLSDLDTRKIEIIKELKRVNSKLLEKMVYGMELTYTEIVDILDVKKIAGSTIGYTSTPKIHEITDINLMLKSSLPNKVEVIIINDNNKRKSNCTNKKTITFTGKSFFTVLGFIQSHLGPLGDTGGFVQLIPGSYKSDRPNNITGIHP